MKLRYLTLVFSLFGLLFLGGCARPTYQDFKYSMIEKKYDNALTTLHYMEYYQRQLDEKFPNGNPPIVEAAQNKQTLIVSILLQYGANPYEVNNQNEIAIDYSLSNGDINTTAVLINYMIAKKLEANTLSKLYEKFPTKRKVLSQAMSQAMDNYTTNWKDSRLMRYIDKLIDFTLQLDDNNKHIFLKNIKNKKGFIENVNNDFYLTILFKNALKTKDYTTLNQLSRKNFTIKPDFNFKIKNSYKLIKTVEWNSKIKPDPVPEMLQNIPIKLNRQTASDFYNFAKILDFIENRYITKEVITIGSKTKSINEITMHQLIIPHFETNDEKTNNKESSKLNKKQNAQKYKNFLTKYNDFYNNKFEKKYLKAIKSKKKQTLFAKEITPHIISFILQNKKFKISYDKSKKYIEIELYYWYPTNFKFHRSYQARDAGPSFYSHKNRHSFETGFTCKKNGDYRFIPYIDDFIIKNLSDYTFNTNCALQIYRNSYKGYADLPASCFVNGIQIILDDEKEEGKIMRSADNPCALYGKFTFKNYFSTVENYLLAKYLIQQDEKNLSNLTFEFDVKSLSNDTMSTYLIFTNSIKEFSPQNLAKVYKLKKEEDAYKKAIKKNTIEALIKFKHKYPKSKYLTEINEKLQSLQNSQAMQEIRNNMFYNKWDSITWDGNLDNEGWPNGKGFFHIRQRETGNFFTTIDAWIDVEVIFKNHTIRTGKVKSYLVKTGFVHYAKITPVYSETFKGVREMNDAIIDTINKAIRSRNGKIMQKRHSQGSNCKVIYKKCMSSCNKKSSKGFFNDKDSCQSACMGGKSACERGEYTLGEMMSCRGICKGVSASDGDLFGWGASSFDKCVDSCTDRIGN